MSSLSLKELIIGAGLNVKKTASGVYKFIKTSSTNVVNTPIELNDNGIILDNPKTLNNVSETDSSKSLISSEWINTKNVFRRLLNTNSSIEDNNTIDVNFITINNNDVTINNPKAVSNPSNDSDDKTLITSQWINTRNVFKRLLNANSSIEDTKTTNGYVVEMSDTGVVLTNPKAKQSPADDSNDKSLVTTEWINSPTIFSTLLNNSIKVNSPIVFREFRLYRYLRGAVNASICLIDDPSTVDPKREAMVAIAVNRPNVVYGSTNVDYYISVGKFTFNGAYSEYARIYQFRPHDVVIQPYGTHQFLIATAGQSDPIAQGNPDRIKVGLVSTSGFTEWAQVTSKMNYNVDMIVDGDAVIMVLDESESNGDPLIVRKITSSTVTNLATIPISNQHQVKDVSIIKISANNYVIAFSCNEFLSSLNDYVVIGNLNNGTWSQWHEIFISNPGSIDIIKDGQNNYVLAVTKYNYNSNLEQGSLAETPI